MTFLQQHPLVELGSNIELSDDTVTELLAWIYYDRHVFPVNSNIDDRDPEQYTSNFGFVDADHVKETFKRTTHLATNVLRLPLRRHLK